MDKEILIEVARHWVKKQDEFGGMPAGHNGLYYDKETPVRNTSHWLITFLKVYEVTKENQFLIAAENCAKFLISDRARPSGKSFIHRLNDKKDKCNGVMGQAWSIEALCEMYLFSKDHKYIEVAKDVFRLHTKNRQLRIWNRIEPDGKELGPDFTFNHQLWFAVCGHILGLLTNDEEILHETNEFLLSLPFFMGLRKEGLICHHLEPVTFAQKLKRVYHNVRRNKNVRNIPKEIGYHSFNLYAFALLKKFAPEHPIFKMDILKKAIDYSLQESYITSLEENIYAYPYNAPGFELPVIWKEFVPNMTGEYSQVVYQKQISKTYSKEDLSFSRGNEDSATLTARIYELTRYF